MANGSTCPTLRFVVCCCRPLFCAGPRVANGPRKLGGPFGASSGKGLSCWAECRDCCERCSWSLIPKVTRLRPVHLRGDLTLAKPRRHSARLECRVLICAARVWCWNLLSPFLQRKRRCHVSSIRGCTRQALRSSHKVNFWVMAGVQVGSLWVLSGGGLFPRLGFMKVQAGWTLSFDCVGVFNILIWKCASNHCGVQFFSFWSGDIAPHPPLLGTYFRTLPTTNWLEQHNVSRLSSHFAHVSLLSSGFLFSFSTLLSSTLLFFLTLPTSAFHLSKLLEVWFLNFRWLSSVSHCGAATSNL